MKITILTIFPEMFNDFLNTSIIKKARLKNLVEINIVDFRSFSNFPSKRVDDYPYGGGAGMILMCQPILDALKSVKNDKSYVVITTPIGSKFDQQMAYKLLEKEEIVIICGHYEGFDARIYDFVDQHISIGDYILTGGELPAMVITDAITRLVEDTISEDSIIEESFEDGLLEYPQYTRPEVYKGLQVPEVLLSGHHENIRLYRLKESLRTTYLNRKDLLKKRKFTEEERKLLEEVIEEEKKQ
ncbi:MAG TPA: tRNA (guanosine(37)-N1)-methyltransferase TrmD [Erysipelotrichaceae bacterium]|jgi:tRNA (guanine37-N1)-methyltransferase|nr:tRNA (guanosine(37)-N1)-methyltransferase TrmD [Erysipelotrichia bacterium]HPX33270.1 tRNA (guanosine(37)-N1)-methyltransferase TrmD [Erysipelotrichaceae bacterium]HQA85655.1 tRNA (guanosine(37)-N1)-methyltransferase TrmD [Erysipelotrichaceae bacterium]